MHPLDYTIIGGYIIGLFIIGFLVAKRASAGSDEYFLAGRRLPWWALGASGMSSNLDVSGTVTIIALIYTYGLQGFWIEMRGGVVLPIAVWLAFMGKWHRRSNVTTTAEWMELRFGRGLPGRLARYTAAATYLIITVAMVVFFLVGAARFIAQFVPFLDPTTAAVLIALVTLIYTMVSGLYGVVWTDVFQAFIIGAAAIYIGVKAFGVAGEIGPDDWPGAAVNTAWPQLTLTGTEYDLLWLFLLFFAGKGILEGLGGSGGSAYMAQRYYAAKSDADCVKLSMLWALLFAFRWPMVIGMAVLAISLGIGEEEPERILSTLLLSDDVFPIGFRGLMVAALLAAAMSTFDSTINAGASYVVKDLYVPLVAGADAIDRPGDADDATLGVSQKKEVIVGYVASAAIVAVGLAFTLTLGLGSGIVEIWTTIVVQFFPAFLMPFALRWFWARFNGIGFVAGTVAGFAAALANTFLIPDNWLNDWQEIAFIGGTSLIVSVAGALMSPAVPQAWLRDFYDQIRPWGLWPRAWRHEGDERMQRYDILRLGVAIVWQLCTFMLPMLVVLHKWNQFAGVGIVWVILSLYLWWDLRRMRAQDPKPVSEAGELRIEN